MKNYHLMTIAWPEGMEEDACTDMLVDSIIKRFPDAMVTGAPSPEINDDGERVISQMFTSDVFDAIHERVAIQVLNELASMIEDVLDKDFPLLEEEKAVSASILIAAHKHIQHRFLGEEDE